DWHLGPHLLPSLFPMNARALGGADGAKRDRAELLGQIGCPITNSLATAREPSHASPLWRKNRTRSIGTSSAQKFASLEISTFFTCWTMPSTFCPQPSSTRLRRSTSTWSGCVRTQRRRRQT